MKTAHEEAVAATNGHETEQSRTLAACQDPRTLPSLAEGLMGPPISTGVLLCGGVRMCNRSWQRRDWPTGTGGTRVIGTVTGREQQHGVCRQGRAWERA